jgi:hypothetical protein
VITTSFKLEVVVFNETLSVALLPIANSLGSKPTEENNNTAEALGTGIEKRPSEFV